MVSPFMELPVQEADQYYSINKSANKYLLSMLYVPDTGDTPGSYAYSDTNHVNEMSSCNFNDGWKREVFSP